MKTLITNKIKSTLLISLVALSSFSAQASHFSNNTEDLVGIAQQALDLVNASRPSTAYAATGRYLLPIRKAAVNLQIMGQMHFPSEGKSICAIKRLEAAIENAENYIDEQLETETGASIVQELLMVQEQLRNFTRDIPSWACTSKTITK